MPTCATCSARSSCLSGISLVVDNTVEELVTLALEDVTALDVVLFIAKTYNLRIEQTGAILRLYRETPPPAPAPEPIVLVETVDGALLLTADLQSVDVREAARLVTQQSGVNVVVPAGVSGTVTVYLGRVPLEEGLGRSSGPTASRSPSRAR